MKILSLILFFILLNKPTLCSGQNLPNIQEKSMRTPLGVKIDGYSTELNNEFQAFNKSTFLFYTLTNDDENFYLVIQSRNIGINNKIMDCGITFTVDPNGRKRERDGASVTFPAITKNYVANTIKSGVGLTYLGNEDNGPKKGSSKDNSRKIIDSLTNLRQKAYLKQAKEIGLSGIDEISSPVISIYNDKNIYAKITISNKNILTYELAVPLKYFKLSDHKFKEIAYQISLNELKGISGGPPSRLVVEGRAATIETGVGGIDGRLLQNRIFFWGTYMLAR